MAVSTQRQALNALVFLYKHLLNIQLEEEIIRAGGKKTVHPINRPARAQRTNHLLLAPVKMNDVKTRCCRRVFTFFWMMLDDDLVEMRRIELLASALRTPRSPS